METHIDHARKRKVNVPVYQFKITKINKYDGQGNRLGMVRIPGETTTPVNQVGITIDNPIEPYQIGSRNL